MKYHSLPKGKILSERIAFLRKIINIFPRIYLIAFSAVNKWILMIIISFNLIWYLRDRTKSTRASNHNENFQFDYRSILINWFDEKREWNVDSENVHVEFRLLNYNFFSTKRKSQMIYLKLVWIELQKHWFPFSVH